MTYVYNKRKKKRRQITKRDNQLAHFRKRVTQRFKITMGDNDVLKIIDDIHNRSENITLIGSSSRRVRVYRVEHGKDTLVVFHDNKTDMLCTAVTQEMSGGDEAVYYRKDN